MKRSELLLPRLGYTLVVCEKPDAARRIGRALGAATDVGPSGIPVLNVTTSKGKRFVICSASGHLFGLDDLTGYRGVFPIFDLEWTIATKSNPRAARIVKTISQFAKNATSFIHACDYDQEGEVIGYAILEFVCNGRYGNSMRAKFSTLLDEEIKQAFDSLEKPNHSFAEAGKSRHLLDFIYGVNLSRALVASFQSSNSAYRNLSIGRVQGPTLAFAADREIEVELHVPDPYWTINAEFESHSGVAVHTHYEEPRIGTHSVAKKVVNECQGQYGAVTRVLDREIVLRPPTPFNIGDLQRESYRLFRVNPSHTLSIAEKLYLSALISYPRTSSQKLPSSINFKKILTGLQRSSRYAHTSAILLAQPRLIPNEGSSTDPAHPAIFPTGRLPRNLHGLEFKIFDLIVKRFFSTFGDNAHAKSTSLTISINDRHRFIAEGKTTTYEGWVYYYKPYVSLQNSSIPELHEGDLLRNNFVEIEESFSKPPNRYTPSSLLSKMEQEGIGTKATRADIIATLLKRGYLSSANRGLIGVTQLGVSIIESMRKYVPRIVSTELTKTMDNQLEMIEQGSLSSKEVIEGSIDHLVEALALFREKKIEVGREIWLAAASASAQAAVIGNCPVCNSGKLGIIRSRSTGKRFIGCSNYSSDGCRASAPLPQRGIVVATRTLCESCRWPKLLVKFARRSRPWIMCANVQCPLKEEKKGYPDKS